MTRADRRVRGGRAVLVAAALTIAAACGSSDSDAQVPAPDVPATVAIGAMPEPLSDRPTVPPPPTVAVESTVTTTEPPPEPLVGPIGDNVLGNRLLMIGDGVLASIAPRFDGIACDVLPGFGWSVEIAAEPGRFVEFGAEVLDARLRPSAGLDWDAAAIMLGNQYDGVREFFERRLTELLERLAPRPVIVYTVTDVDGARSEINDVIRELPRFHPNVVVIDWAEITLADPGELLADDGPGLTDEGSGRLVVFTAGALGEAPGDDDGGCLEPVFTDDSAIVL